MTFPPGNTDRRICNGLASNCGWRVNEIMYPAVHNAYSSKENGFLEANNLLSLEVGRVGSSLTLMVEPPYAMLRNDYLHGVY